MQLTSKTFKDSLTALESTYLNWKLPKDSVTTWKKVLSLVISDEFYPMVILDWISHITTPPKNPAEIIKHASEMVSKEYGSADTSADIIIDSARNAYYVTDDFENFTAEYENSFASILGTPAQEAYIKENIRNRSSNPKILILVYDELKGSIKECFTGDAEHGIEFLRNNIKKSWKEKVDDAVKEYLKSGNTDFRRLAGSGYGQLEA